MNCVDYSFTFFKENTMKKCWVLIAIGIILVVVSAVTAATFTWTGGGSNTIWSTTANWSASGCFNCYPSQTNDDATIPSSPAGYIVSLIEESIDGLTMQGDADFYWESSAVTLTTDSLIITGAARVEVHDEDTSNPTILVTGIDCD